MYGPAMHDRVDNLLVLGATIVRSCLPAFSVGQILTTVNVP